MKAFSLDGDDLEFNGKEFVVLHGIEQLAQEAELSVGTIKGEWFLDEEAGFDMSSITTKPFNANEFRTDLIASLEGTSSTLSVTKLDLDLNYQSRKAFVTFEAITDQNELLQIATLGVDI